jgi:hypothetical protein
MTNNLKETMFSSNIDIGGIQKTHVDDKDESGMTDKMAAMTKMTQKRLFPLLRKK